MLRVPPWKLVSIIGDWIGNDPHCKTAGQNSVTGNCVTAAGLKDSTLPKNIRGEGPENSSTISTSKGQVRSTNAVPHRFAPNNYC